VFPFLKRHPLPIQAHFRHSLVLTYALPRTVLEPLLAPGLELDTFGDLGFLAIALVQTQDLRPLGAPRALGQDFILSGYRIFSRFTTGRGRHLRGLRILRSDTNRWPMVLGGNLLTHYHYRKASVDWRDSPGTLDIRIQTPRAADGKGEADLEVHANLGGAALPPGSPFASLEEARGFAGPLPFTFDYEAETHSIVVIKGVRKKWDPQPVDVTVRRCSFLEREPFAPAKPILANAFHIQNVPYHWERGRLEPLPPEAGP
jgi:hypothetical protein